jgi:uncharacterized protein YjbI with pentapeptide repeats
LLSKPLHRTTAAELEAIESCALPGEAPGARAKWAIIDARTMTAPAELAAALRAAPAGQRRIVRGGNFTGADMREPAALLANACLVATDLDGTNWENTIVPGLRLVRVALTNAKASGAHWSWGSMLGTNFAGTDFTGGRPLWHPLRFGVAGRGFWRGPLQGGQPHRGDLCLRITVDEWCINAAPDLTDTNLTGADISGLGLWDAQMNLGATLDNTTVSPRSLVNLGGARITGPLRLASYFTPTYPDRDYAPVTATISAAEARTIIDGTLAARRRGGSPELRLRQGGRADRKDPLRRIRKRVAQPRPRAGRGLGGGAGGGEGRPCRTAPLARFARHMRWGPDVPCRALSGAHRGFAGRARPGITLAPGESVTYEDDTLPLPDAMRRGALYERILPVLAEASGQEITLTGNRDGSIAVEGSAVRANAHTCELARPSPASIPKPAGGVRRAIRRRRAAVSHRGSADRAALQRNFGNTPEAASAFMSCGMRAFFDDGVDLTPG